ncbi:MAG: filamentous hemagglutinin N-terminal domain-containing protein [Oscillatoria sp. SIO1A7]|nr:filamentous hemagglutinin N-terminal domain-containing protein [Oscillatoria sp. SIO1A7]
MKPKLYRLLRLTFLTSLWLPTLGVLRPISGLAQVFPDGTLNTTVAPAPELGGNVLIIEGGTTAGNNLFHSFSEFSIPEGTGAIFNNALDINNIFSRVTGGSISNIDGFIAANGAANLFLLNPNGIIFGPSASLDLGGSFLGTSAESIVFQDGTSFNATNTGGQPLLTVSVPVGLQFGTAPGDIVNIAGAIPLMGAPPGTPPGTPPPDAMMQPGAVPPGAVPPGAVPPGTLPPGAVPPGAVPPGTLPPGAVPPGAVPPGAVPPGTLPPGAVIPPGTIPPGAPPEGLEPGMPPPGFDGPPPTVGLQVEPGRTLALVGGNLFLPGGMVIAPQGRIELGAVGDNSLVNLALTPAGFSLDYSGVENFGDIQLSQLALVNVSGPGAGFVQVQGGRVALDQGSQITANSENLDGGGITVRASESLDLISGGQRGPSGLVAQTFGAGAGGSIDISTQRLTVRDGAMVSSQVAQTASGAGGSINVNASESVNLISGGPGGASGFIAQTSGAGAGGSIDISTQGLTVEDGAAVSSQVAQTASGAGGSINVNASEFVNLIGSPSGPTGLVAQTSGAGAGGSIDISTQHLTVLNGAQVSSSVALTGSGAGGSIDVNASESVVASGAVSLDGQPQPFPSGLGATTLGAGQGGDLTITTGQLIVSDEATIRTDTGLQQAPPNAAGAMAPDMGGPAQAMPPTNPGMDGMALQMPPTGNPVMGDPAQAMPPTQNPGMDGMALQMPPTGNPVMGDPAQVMPPTNPGMDGMALQMPPTGNPVMGDPAQAMPPNPDAGMPPQMPLPNGDGGDLTINARQLIVSGRAQILTSAFGNGYAGSLNITASESVEVNGAFESASEVEVNGADNVFVQVTGILSQAEFGSSGDGGDLTIETPLLSIINGGRVSTGTIGSGNGGDLMVTARGGLVEVVGAVEVETSEGLRSSPSALFTVTGNDGNGIGNAGNLTIDTGQLVIQEGQVSADTAGAGQGGILTVNASESVEVSGQFRNAPFPAVLSVATSGSGDGGDLTINTRRLTITEGARVSARTSGEGLGGTLTVNDSESVEVIGENSILSAGSVMPQDNAEIPSPRARTNIDAGSAISSPTLQGEGMIVSPSDPDNRPPRSAGNLNITTGQLTVRDGAEVSVSGEGTGAAGSLSINATDEIRLDNGRLEADTDTNPPNGESANIDITTPDLLLSNNSLINAEASGEADGGNVQIRTGNLVAGDNSDISANAEDGNGGNIQIDTSGDIRSFNSSITASSERGIDGVVDVNRPEIDPASGLAELEEEPVDPESLIARGCSPNNQQGSRFVNTERGGVYPGPGNNQGGDGWYEDFRPIDGDRESSMPSTPSASENTQSIVEARGWQFNAKGQVVLTAEAGDRGAGGQAGQNALHPTPHTLHPNVGCDGVADSSGKPKQLEERSPSSFPSVPKQIVVEEFQVVGSTVFEPEEFAEVLKPFTNRPLSFEELLSARQAVSQLYAKKGYITSGVYIPPQTVANGNVTLESQENGLEEINIIAEDSSDRRLGNYIKSRLERASSPGPVSAEKIVEALRLLQLEQDLIESISAELSEGSRPGLSVLDVKINGKRPYGTEFSLDNRRSPSVGSLRGAANLYHANLLGLGDRLDLSYSRTDGSDTVEFDYAVPINSSNTTLGFRFSNADSDVVEPPFDRLDIDANSRNYELTLRQPLIRRSTDGFTRELAFGLSASRRESETSLLGDRFPLSAGANNNGETRISALRFFQEWTQQEDQQVFALRSQFSLGLGAFDATINNDEPDSRFFAWRGQGQWARSLGRRGLVLVRGDLQLATTSLVPFEQFGVGGFDSVRGYRQDARLRDNGAFASVEARLPLPIFSGTDSLVQVIPFLDAGTGWNSGDRDAPDESTLVSAGLGLRYQLSDIIDARLDFGIPLIDIDSRDRTWQENGIYFSIKVNPF